MTDPAKRRAARNRRRMRRDLVHAAGCTHDNCIVRVVVRTELELINEACAMGIRIPRSIAAIWGAR
jgi:hypothetical protein